MTTPYAPPRDLQAPTPVPHRFGLFAVATVIDQPDLPHWELGGVWQPIPCGPASSWPMTCTIEGNPGKDDDKGVPYVEALPFAVYGWFACSPIGHWDDARERALQHLLAGAERAVEAALYTNEDNQGNALGLAVTLVDASTVDVTPTVGTPVTVAEGVALLESWLGLNNHSPGMIWANPREVTAMAAGVVLRQPAPSETVLRTFMGTPVAATSGMSGIVAPDGTDEDPEDGAFWIYASGVPVIRRSAPIQFDRGSQLNRANNDLIARAEQVFTGAWDCGAAAVLVQTINVPEA